MEQKLFSLFLFVHLIISSLCLFADDLTVAQDFEKAGRPEDARHTYVRWLGNPGNAGDPAYGRILIHALRIAGTVDEDLDLINRFYKNLSQADDKLDIYETAVVLTELISRRDLNSNYLDLLNSLQTDLFTSSYPALERLMIQEHYGRENFQIFPPMKDLPARLRKLYILMSLRDREDADHLDDYIEGLEKDNPFLTDEPEWLYLVSQRYVKSGLTDKAEAYMNLLKKRFPQSVETALLSGGRIRPYPRPEEYLTEGSDTASPVPSSDLEIRESTYIQAGAFQNPENAMTFKANLEAYGLVCRIAEEGSVFKIIIVTDDYDSVVKLLDSLGIKGFRIPRIP